ncbi:MAG TPA: hypothetical protein VHR27_21700 [Blastocatellia bacterium]|jgi:hypothetical protein|nr:hypothetical protein [Blastocatellia bacterium]
MNQTIRFGRRFCLIALSAWLLPLTGCVLARGQRYHHFTTPTPLEENKILILGFLGGREPWNNPHRNVRKLALKLRAQYPDTTRVETVENKKRNLALELIRRAFDRNHDGQLDAQERANVRLIIYGQSFGGAAVVKLARELERMGAPVLLTVQVDSVGRGDRIIPANVARAANLFQRNGLFIRGEPEVRAQDPSRTVIIGNFEFDYRNKKIDLSEESRMKRLFRVAHTKMDFDPAVWSLVEELIVKEIKRPDDERRN